MSSREKMVRVTSVAPLDGFELRVGFTDGTERVIDVERFLRGADIDPDVLYGLREPAWAKTPASRS
jgi:hypothetical protein